VSERYVVWVVDRDDPDYGPYLYGPFDSTQEAEGWIKQETDPNGAIVDAQATVQVLNLP